jgi:SAM-dependent methyltransferase
MDRRATAEAKESERVRTSVNLSDQSDSGIRNSTTTQQESVTCPVCGGDATPLGTATAIWEWYVCDSCTLQFVSPMDLGDDPRSLYDSAYKGRVSTSSMHDFAYRLKVRDSMFLDPTLWFWTPAFHRVIAWLQENIARGRTVLDVGCGPGLFLHALRRAGFEAVGLDVAKEAVDMNVRDGFLVWHGPVESLQHGWVQPDAVVCMFVLHHIVDPMGMLRYIRTSFPKALVAVAQYGPTNFDPSRTSPPRTLTRWSKKALETVLEKCNYTSEVIEIQSTGTESRIMRPFMRVRHKLSLSPGAYRLTKKVERDLLPAILAPFQREAFVLLGFARPNTLSVLPDLSRGLHSEEDDRESRSLPTDAKRGTAL